ncbi:hemagglutinin repeat-containing protein [Rhodoferax sediminis]|uniref:Filamentous hemagglutinin N-terminal domain-containing protein n=1 Tax=Rhodoferax sediminis TaxID=2509614 RepID=A0A515D7H0_9BURK|nr:hemagglutinin repeat-containing protein [Rhodoferax sediminis]QDL36365.1 filamentous hemagglutinin N-terminal domain-containing protein [Rhodoferax sediminis]
MNKNCYRIIFNAGRGQRMAVAETAASQGKNAAGQTRGGAASRFSGSLVVTLRPASFTVFAALGLVFWMQPPVQAQIVADPGASRTQQPTVLAAPNGVPVVNIQTPSAAGVSRNTYRQFDVNQPGAILNNSRANVQTQTGGWVQGNPWLAAGGARVILNEVNSSNPSQLRGYVEVAGQRAEVIIANPAGINIDGGGFINASRVMLTTGTPVMNGGSLDGYRVQDGNVSVGGLGLDTSAADYTAILARAVQVNAGIWAKELKVTTGANQVDAGQISATPIAGTGTAPAFALDAAALGGMYAGKITLIGTEAGVGVRNAGVIGATAGDVVLQSDGWLSNSGSIQAAGHAQINTTGVIDNSGSIYAGGNTNLASQGSINTTGLVAAQGHTRLQAGSYINAGTGSVVVAGLNADGTLASSGDLSVTAADAVVLRGQTLAAGNASVSGTRVSVADGKVTAKNFNLTARGGDVDASRASVGIEGTFNVNATQTLRTDGASVSADQLTLAAHDASNVGGEIVQTGNGDTALRLGGDLNNSAGRIATNSQNLALAARTLTNTDGRIEHAGERTLAIQAGTLNDQRGQITSNGALQLAAGSVNHDGASTLAQQVAIAVIDLSNRSGEITQTGTLAARISVTGTLDNTGGKIASNGDTMLGAQSLLNRGGSVQAAGAAKLEVATIAALDNSAGGHIAAGSNVSLHAGSLNNSQGQITAGGSLGALADAAISNIQGLVAANGAVNLAAASLNNTQGTVASVQDNLNVATGGATVNDSGMLQAAQDVTLNTTNLSNHLGTIAAGGSAALQTGALNNDGGLVQAAGALAIDTNGSTLTNTHAASHASGAGGITSQSTLTLATGDLDNVAGFIGARGALSAATANVSNSAGGQVVGESSIAISGTAFDNRGGQVQALGDVSLHASAGSIDNSASLIRSAGTTTLSAGTVRNSDTGGANQGIEGNYVAITADSIANDNGAIRADSNAALTSSGGLNNSTGLISAGNTLAVHDSTATKTLVISNTGGTVIAGQSASVDAAGLTGDGKVLSRGDLTIALTTDFSNSGEVTANHNASLGTTGNLTNSGKLQAGATLRVSASNIDNTAGGEITGASTQVTATNTLTNRGLIDGQDTQLNAATLNNLGAGRIYGDHLSMAAGTVSNDMEGAGAATIAARQRLDIGAGTVNNREGALIFSAGDMAIGGSLDANRLASGQAAAVNNASATIEVLGNLDINAAQVNNTNNHFSTEQRFVSSQSIVEYSPTGSPNHYAENQVRLYYPDENIHLISPEGDAYDFNRFSYVRTVTETAQATSDPGKLLAGGNMTLNTQSLRNDKSHIIAGAALNASAANLENTTVPGTRQTQDNGVATHYYVIFRSGPDGQGADDSPYVPPATLEGITLSPTRYDAFTASVGSGTTLTDTALGSVNATTGATGAVNATVHSVSQVNASVGNVAPSSGGAQIVRAVQVNTRIPNTSLFHVNSNPAGSYLIETDPRFASYRQWLSSNYMLQALNIDPAITQKRLGDGFYEQRLVREQLAQLTGQRFLGNYNSDEEQYQALMQAGITYVGQWQLRPGVALTAEQMAQLTSDIVWLVEQQVTLPDGKITTALVPQVYARVQDGDLASSGALLAGREINLNLSGDLTNSGTLAGRQVVNLAAENIQNLGGRIQSDVVSVSARQDLNNIGGTIQAASALSATAGRDLNVVTTTRSADSVVGGNSFSRTSIDRVASLYVTGPNGTLMASAGRDANIIAGVIASSGQGGGTTVVAGNNLNLGTITTSSANQIVWDAKNRRSDGASTEVGSQIQSTGTVHLAAGNDLNARAANVEAAGAVFASAGHDLNMSAGQSSQSVDEAHQHTSRGFLSSRTDTTLDQVKRTDSVGSSFSGSTVTALAGRDLTVSGSSVVSDTATTLLAQNNIVIEAASNTSEEQHLVAQKKSGLLGSGGIGFTIGTREQSTDGQSRAIGHTASTVGAINGDVTIIAGNQYQHKGSDLVAPGGDINVLAKNIAISEVQNTEATQAEQKFKQSGLTVALTSPVLSALQTGQQMMQAAGNTGDGRMQALAVANGAFATRDVYNALQAGQSSTGNNPGAATEHSATDKAGGINVSISVGGSKSQSNSSSSASSAQGSTIAAGGNVNLTASGAGLDSNLTVQGSDIRAGYHISLNADNAIALLAAQNTASQDSSNTSSSGSLGVSFGTGGFGVTASASKGRGNADGSDLTWTNTHIEAGHQLSLNSGGDTTLKGAVASGQQVRANVGGNLAIESLQDSSRYASKDQSMGGSITVGAGVSGSLNLNKSRVNSDFASVTEQSGIRAGDGGFHVDVKGNTDLKGGVIANTDKVVQGGKNTLVTATLTTSDLQNRAQTSASNSGINLDSGMLNQGKYGVAKALVGTALNDGKASGSSAGVTRSAVEAGNVTITDDAAQQVLTGKSAQETAISLNRDTFHAHTAVQQQDVQAMERTAQAEQAIKQAVFVEMVKFSNEAYRTTFIEKHPMYEILQDKDGKTQFDEKTGKPVLRELSDEEKRNLKPGPDGKVHVAANGIFNDQDAASSYGNQHTTTTGPQYVIYFPETNNAVSELMVAGYQKFLENDFWGLSNSTSQVKDAMHQYGQTGLQLDGHSRGAMTLGNGLESQAASPNAQGSLSQTTVNFFGPAYNGQQADNLLSTLQDRANLPAAQQPSLVLQFQNHAADPVGRWVGSNPPTGGTISEGSSQIKEALRAVTGQSTTVHNCYGQSQDPNCGKFWRDTGGFPALIPVPVSPAQGASQ